MSGITRRGALTAPLLLLPAARASAVGLYPEVPPFTTWVGRTALLNGDGGAARILLGRDGGGRLSIKLFLFCRTLPINHWEIAADGMTLTYTRPSAVVTGRIIAGQARILPGAREVAWIEAAAHTAQFEGFADPVAAERCS